LMDAVFICSIILTSLCRMDSLLSGCLRPISSYQNKTRRILYCGRVLLQTGRVPPPELASVFLRRFLSSAAIGARHRNGTQKAVLLNVAELSSKFNFSSRTPKLGKPPSLVFKIVHFTFMARL
jgi:hypothetical protein